MGTMKVLTNLVLAERKQVKQKKARFLHAGPPALVGKDFAVFDESITVRDFHAYNSEATDQLVGSVLLSNVDYKRG
jgi:hypothetical protein